DLAKGWEIYSHQPRYLTNYVGLRNRLAILDENYVYADYKTRVLSCYALLRSILDYCRDHAGEIRGLVSAADARASERWRNAAPADPFHTAFELKPLPEKIVILGYEVEVTPREGTWPLVKRTDRKRTYTVDYYADVVPTSSAPFAWGYFLPAADPDVVKKLLQHGLVVEKLTRPVKAEVEGFRITELKPAPRLFQGHWMTQVKGERFKETREFPAGTVFVGTANPLGSLAACLLDPESDDGLLLWNFFDRQLVPQWGRGFLPYPVYRALAPLKLEKEPCL
ncbi:MAG: hypothetical protein JW747_04605, partial [Candidatus Aminicenantes bacterium]|nr:hypothetical protein [Candidatus Aminicenantes bacterium]